MKMVCPCYLLCKKRQSLACPPILGTPNATSKMTLVSISVSFLLPSQSQHSSSPLLTTEFGKSCNGSPFERMNDCIYGVSSFLQERNESIVKHIKVNALWILQVNKSVYLILHIKIYNVGLPILANNHIGHSIIAQSFQAYPLINLGCPRKRGNKKFFKYIETNLKLHLHLQNTNLSCWS